jgi:DNA-binding NarL/FixJ family response regulator
VDLNLKGSSGLEAIRGMLARKPGLRVLVLSMYDSAGHVRQALKSGAHGYLTKFSEPDDVIDALRRVAAGRRAFSADVADVLADQATGGATPLQDLTPASSRCCACSPTAAPRPTSPAPCTSAPRPSSTTCP